MHIRYYAFENSLVDSITLYSYQSGFRQYQIGVWRGTYHRLQMGCTELFRTLTVTAAFVLNQRCKMINQTQKVCVGNFPQLTLTLIPLGHLHSALIP